MTRQMTSAAVGMAMLVLAAACGAGDPTPTATPTASAPDSPEAALAQAIARWETSGLANYDYLGAWSCFCPEEDLAEAKVTVNNGEVTGVGSADPSMDAIPDPERFVPIEGLFALIQDALDRDASRVEVSYDATYGYPVDLFIDYEARMTDEEDRFAISSFTPR